MFRLPVHLALELLIEVKPFVEEYSIPLHIEFFSALHFYGRGTYQTAVGKDANTCLSQTKISNSIRKFSKAISTQLMLKYVKFPQTEDEITSVSAKFEEDSGFKNCIGIIDGTHVALTALRKEIEHGYINRKGFHSLNVQIICESELRITNVNARYPGRNHDSYIYGNSQIYTHLERRHQQGYNHYLLGDSGYPLQPWLLNPIPTPTTAREKHYNKIHAKTRSKVERTIGLAKNVFRCIIGERKLRYDPVMAGHIINTCVVLHNFCRFHNLPYEEFSYTEPDQPPHIQEAGTSYFNQGLLSRTRVMNELFDA